MRQPVTKADYIISEIRALNLFCTEAEVKRQIARLYPDYGPANHALVFEVCRKYAAQEFAAARNARRT